MSLRDADIEVFLELSGQIPALDVRSEGEWDRGHIPGAFNFPILNNEERAMVGTCYKEHGHETAVLLGYELTTPKFPEYISQARIQFPGGKVLIHCYRGGLRSKIMGNLLHSAGFEVTLLKRGYKAYRHHVLDKLQAKLILKVLGGYTGSGKTSILQLLKKSGLQVLDIEALASHRGSAYGQIGLPPQPTQEQFENNLAADISNLDLDKPIWIEDESNITGQLKTPDVLFEQLRNGPLYFLDYPIEYRIRNIVDEYCKFDVNLLIEATYRIKKRLGDQRLREAISFLEERNYNEWLKIVLQYYDKAYLNGLQYRGNNGIFKVQLYGEKLVEYLIQETD